MQACSDLGNFLSGMETEVRGLAGRRPVGLGNFLSGMETPLAGLPCAVSRYLGNFLSGMETSEEPQADTVLAPLETSLVEWKRKVRALRALLEKTLETSLVEWKHGIEEIITSLLLALKTF